MYTPILTLILVSNLDNVESNVIEQCLESVSSQSFTDLEVLIYVPQEHTNADIIRKYTELDNRFFIKNLSLYDTIGLAYNDALLSAKGKYVGIVYPNTPIDVDFYANLIKKSCITGCPVIAGKIIHYFNNTLKNEDSEYTKSISKDPYKFIEYPQIALYEKSFLRENSIFWSTETDYEGLLFLIMVSSYIDVIPIADTYCHMYQQENSPIKNFKSFNQISSYFAPRIQALKFILHNQAAISFRHTAYVIAEILIRQIYESITNQCDRTLIAQSFYRLISIIDNYANNMDTGRKIIVPTVEAFILFKEQFSSFNIKKIRDYEYILDFVKKI